MEKAVKGMKRILDGNGRTIAGCFWTAIFFAVFSSELWGWIMPLPLWILGYFAVNLAIVWLVRKICGYEPFIYINEKITSFVNDNLSDKEFFIMMLIFMLIPWIIAYLAMFPGTYGYDVPLQVGQFFGYEGAQISSKHPVAHTLLVGAFLSIGESVFQDYSTGFALFTAFQMILIVTCAARSLLFLKKHFAPTIIILIGALWAAWNPVLQLLGMNATKDILFGVFLLHFLMDLWYCLEADCLGTGSLLQLALSAVLMCLFRNQGIYILIGLVILLPVFRVKGKDIYIVLISAIAACIAFFTFCTYGLKMEPGDKKEMLPVPIQQVAYVSYFYLHGNPAVKMSEEQFAIVQEVIPDKAILENLLFDTADPVKEVFRTDVLAQNFSKHLGNYIAIGMQNPGMYWEAVMRMILPYWDMRMNEYSDISVKYTFSERNFLNIQPQSRMERYYQYMTDIACKVKGRWYLSVCGVGMWLLAILSGMAVARGNRNMALGCMPMILYVFTMLLGPVALLRYLFPLMLATPLLLGAVFMRSEEQAVQKLDDSGTEDGEEQI